MADALESGMGETATGASRPGRGGGVRGGEGAGSRGRAGCAAGPRLRGTYQLSRDTIRITRAVFWPCRPVTSQLLT